MERSAIDNLMKISELDDFQETFTHQHLDEPKKFSKKGLLMGQLKEDFNFNLKKTVYYEKRR
jgi:hypothetical protein